MAHPPLHTLYCIAHPITTSTTHIYYAPHTHHHSIYLLSSTIMTMTMTMMTTTTTTTTYTYITVAYLYPLCYCMITVTSTTVSTPCSSYSSCPTPAATCNSSYGSTHNSPTPQMHSLAHSPYNHSPHGYCWLYYLRTPAYGHSHHHPPCLPIWAGACSR